MKRDLGIEMTQFVNQVIFIINLQIYSLVETSLVFRNGTLISDDVVSPYEGLDIESTVIGPLKLWHVCGLGIALLMTIVIAICCCVDVRIPRTKQQIEASYAKRKIHDRHGEKFINFSNRKQADNFPENADIRDNTETFINHIKLNPMSNDPVTKLMKHMQIGQDKLRPSQEDMIKTLHSLKTH